MNWDAAGAIGEMIGAVAVVASVIYLAVQIRKQTQEARLAATRDLATQFQAGLDLIVQDKELCAAWGKGVQNYLGLPDEERLRIALLMQRITRVLEAQFLHEINENVDSSYFESVKLGYFEGMTYPGYQQWWELSRDLFDVQFREYIDGLVVEAKQKGYTSSFKKVQEPPRDGASELEM